MKILLIIIDGLGDGPIPQFGGKTPLEKANTPNFDSLTKEGVCGLLEPFKFLWQRYPTSDVSHLAIFGYDPQKYYFGRGPYEAVGIGLKLKYSDVALRVNFATIDNRYVVLDRRAGRITDTSSLVEAISGIKIDGISFLVKRSYGHRAVLVMRGRDLSDEISSNDPEKIGKRVKSIHPLNKNAVNTAKALQEFIIRTHAILNNHPLNIKRKKIGLRPANYLLIRGAGKIRKIPKFNQRYKLKAACVAGGALYKGIAQVLGMKILKVNGANGLPNTNLINKIIAVKKALKKYEFVFCHIKAVDSFAEDGRYIDKKIFLEKIDKSISWLGRPKNTLICVTGDHSTCSLKKSHCNIPVPLVIWKEGINADKVQKFGETTCKRGALGLIPGIRLMRLLLDYAGNEQRLTL